MRPVVLLLFWILYVTTEATYGRRYGRWVFKHPIRRPTRRPIYHQPITPRYQPFIPAVPVHSSFKNTGDLSACQLASRPYQCNSGDRYRSYDGSCNNLYNPTWGQASRPYDRLLSPDYEGQDEIRSKTYDGQGHLPSARKISNSILSLANDRDSSSRVTTMLMVWGQFIAHDLVFTPMVPKRQCCGNSHNDCIPIDIPVNDPYWRGSKTCMELRRSRALTQGQCGQPYREQLNFLTSYIDGSVVYGNSESEARKLRTFDRGQLKTGVNSKLPVDHSKHGEDCNIPSQDRDQACPAAGDTRSNEWHGLTSLHVMFLNQHNIIASKLYDRLRLSHSYLSSRDLDEKAYQEARRIIGAILQVINYKEYLPKVIGQQKMRQYGLNLGASTYRRQTDATAFNVFAVSAFRFGHSEIPLGSQGRDRYYGSSSQPFITMVKSFNSKDIYQQVGPSNTIRAMIVEPALSVDANFVDDVKNRLFERTFNGAGLDLPAVNIQRARDHGIRSYNEWRRYCGLPEVRSFYSMPDHDAHISSKFAEVYSHPDDVDLFAAGITERPVAGDAEVGPTFACLLGEQFKKMKDGDRFWFENQGTYLNAFTHHQIDQLSKMTLSRVICDTADVYQVPTDVFLYGSPFTWCSNLPDLDLDNWLQHTEAY